MSDRTPSVNPNEVVDHRALAEGFLAGATKDHSAPRGGYENPAPSALERAVQSDRTLTNQCSSGQCVRYAVEAQTQDSMSQALNRYGVAGRVIRLSDSMNELINSKGISFEQVQQVISNVTNLGTTHGTMLEMELITLRELRERLERGERVVIRLNVSKDNYTTLTPKSASSDPSENSGHAVTITGIRPDGTLEKANSGAGSDNFGRDKQIKT